MYRNQIPFLRGPEESWEDDIALPRVDRDLRQAALHEHILDQMQEAIKVFAARDGGAIPSVSYASRKALVGVLAGTSLPELTNGIGEASLIVHDTLTVA